MAKGIKTLERPSIYIELLKTSKLNVHSCAGLTVPRHLGKYSTLQSTSKILDRIEVMANEEEPFQEN